MRQLGELPLADLTPVGLDAEVDPGVLGEVGAVGERFIARGTLVGLGFSHVDLGVELEVSFASEDLGTHLALVLPSGLVVGGTPRGWAQVTQVRGGAHLGNIYGLWHYH